MAQGSEDRVPALIAHFERFLGQIKRGWSVDPDGASMPFQIVQFSSGSDPDSVGYATLGLGRHQLASPTSGRVIRHELLILAPRSLSPDRVVSLLYQLGSTTLSAHRSLVRGEVLGPADPLIPQSEMTALYVTAPAYFPDDFAVFKGADGDVVMAWLVPISAQEADFVGRHGWEAFEDLLARHDPDLVDFARAGLAL